MRLRYAINLCTLCLQRQPSRIHQRIALLLLYERDPRLPTVLNCEEPREEIHLNTYKGEVIMRLTGAWDLAKTNVKRF